MPAGMPAGESVVSGLRNAALREAAASATVFDQRRLGAADNHHFQDLASGIPNLNWAGGTSRPRYFQIRGVGERSQFAGAGAPNYSVGFLMDDVDLSGLGSAGVLQKQRLEEARREVLSHVSWKEKQTLLEILELRPNMEELDDQGHA